MVQTGNICSEPRESSTWDHLGSIFTNLQGGTLKPFSNICRIHWPPDNLKSFFCKIARISDPSTGRGRKRTTTPSSLDNHQLPHRSISSRSMLKRSPCLLLLPRLRPLRRPRCRLSQCTRTQQTLCMQMRRRFRRVDHRLPKVLLSHQQPGKGRRRGTHGRERCLERTRHRGRGIKTTLTGIKAWRENWRQSKVKEACTRRPTVRQAARRRRSWQWAEPRWKTGTLERAR